MELSVNGEKGSAAGIVQAYASASWRMRGRTDGTAEAERHHRKSRHADTAAGRAADRCARPRPLQPDAELPALHGARHPRGAGHDDRDAAQSAQNIAREKELGTLEQLNVTPITRGEFITAKLLPFWVLGLLEFSLGLIVGKLVFDIPMVGSLLLLYGAARVYLAVALGIGLWISTLVETQQQAMFVTFFIVIIYLLMSGLFTPIDSMAPWVQAVSQINPVRHFVTISRAILMKGAGPAAIVEPLSILAISAVVILTLAVRHNPQARGLAHHGTAHTMTGPSTRSRS